MLAIEESLVLIRWEERDGGLEANVAWENIAALPVLGK